MQTRKRLFDDAARLAGGAVGTLAGIRREVEALVRQQLDRVLESLDLVTRDEFDAVKAMAAAARAEQDALRVRLEALEKSAGRKGAASKPRKQASARSGGRKAAKRPGTSRKP